MSEPGGDRQAKSDAPLRLVSHGHDRNHTLVQSKCHDNSPDPAAGVDRQYLECKTYEAEQLRSVD